MRISRYDAAIPMAMSVANTSILILRPQNVRADAKCDNDLSQGNHWRVFTHVYEKNTKFNDNEASAEKHYIRPAQQGQCRAEQRSRKCSNVT